MAKRKPAALLFKDDFEQVSRWVLSYPNKETGGQMFGLWTHQGNPYINVITGPGQNCRHGTHSFHQDIDYLKNVGTYLNKQFMLCHIGEWHSHHQLRLREPSSGDLNSIWKHFPAGLEHFLLIIATIEDDGVRLNPWLFTASTHSHESIEVTIIDKDNVFMRDDKVVEIIKKGAEGERQIIKKAVHVEKQKPKPPPTDWYQTDWGCIFVQLLHSQLEKIIDKSTNIDKGKEKGCLRFYFQRNTCQVVLTFPRNFPRSALAVTCYVPESRHPLEWGQSMEDSSRAESFVDKLVDNVVRSVPQVDWQYKQRCKRL